MADRPTGRPAAGGASDRGSGHALLQAAELEAPVVLVVHPEKNGSHSRAGLDWWPPEE